MRIVLIILCGWISVAYAKPGLEYQVVVAGVDSAWQTSLKAISQAAKKQNKPPLSLLLLKRRAKQDVPKLIQKLHAAGYFNAKVNFDLDKKTSPMTLVFQVALGTRFHIGEINIDSGQSDWQVGLQQLSIKIGDVAQAKPVLAAEQQLLALAKQQGYAFATLGQRKITLNRRQQLLNITYVLQLGDYSRLGAVTFQGGQSVKTDFLQQRVPWQLGEPYTPQQIAKLREAVIETDLFRSAQIVMATQLNAQGLLPVTVVLDERKPRSIGIGLHVNSNEGLILQTQWQHRNFAGRGERVAVDLTASALKQSLLTSLEKPDVYHRGQKLLAHVEIKNENTDAYDSLALDSYIGLERLLQKGLTAKLGIEFLALQDSSNSYGFLNIPASVHWDFSDNVLDPTQGGQLSLEAAPFIDVFGRHALFGRALGRYRHYWQLLANPRLVFAGRVAMGSILGTDRDNVPASLRFYSGGGGSVRGYGYQLVSPLDASHNPVGGRSLFEVAAELRYRMKPNIGLVAFWDAGGAFEASYPDFSASLLTAVGLGVRYVTVIGPLRVDVAVPLDKRLIDDSWQIYVGIGQAF